MFFGEIITVYCDGHTKHINTLSEQGTISQCSGIWYMLLSGGLKRLKTEEVE